MNRIILFIVALSYVGIIHAQNKLSGTIYNAETNEKLANASIYFPDLNLGCQSDAEGNFSTEKLPNKTLKIEVSYLGFKPQIQIIPAGEKNRNIEIKLEPVAMQTNEVVVSGGTHTTQHDDALKIELIKSGELRSSSAMSFSEHLNSIPGVESMSYGPAVTKPVIRGLSLTNILVLNDGVKLENFQFSENHPFIIDEFGADRIEIIKGPASLLYGSDAVGGVINLIPEKPAPVGTIQADFNTAFHSNTLGNQSQFGIKGSTRQLSWNVRAGMRSHQDYIDGNGNSIPNTRFNEQSFKAGLNFRNSIGNHKLTYQYNRPKLGMSVAPAIALVNENSRENEFWYQDLTQHLFIFKNKLYLSNWKLDVNAAYQMNNRRLQTSFDTPAFEMVNMQLNTLSMDVKTYIPLKSQSEWIVGMQAAHKTNTNFDAPNRVIPDAKVIDVSGLSFFSHAFPKNIRFQAGIRYDFRHLSANNKSGVEYLNNEYANFSASTGATWRITKDLLLRGNLASAFRTPNLAELSQDGVHGVRYEQGNENLNSQRSYEADLSMHYHNKWLLFDVAGFYHKINQYIYLAPTNDSINGYQIYKYNQSDALLYGSEISMDILATNWLDIRASYAYIKATQENGENLPLIPQNKIKLNLRLQDKSLWKFKDVNFNLGGLYAFAKEDVAAEEESTNDYFLLHAGVSTGIKVQNQTLRVGIRVNNLLNESYTDHLSNLKELGQLNMGRNIVFNLNIPIGIK